MDEKLMVEVGKYLKETRLAIQALLRNADTPKSIGNVTVRINVELNPAKEVKSDVIRFDPNSKESQ